jgi:hypothetical protein
VAIALPVGALPGFGDSSAANIPESGYSHTSGSIIVLTHRVRSSASLVFTIWCAVSGPPAGANTQSPVRSACYSPPKRSVPLPDNTTGCEDGDARAVLFRAEARGATLPA